MLKPNEQRAKIAIAMIWIIFVINILSIFSDYFQYLLVKDARDGESISNIAAAANDSRQQLIAILNLIALIISGITFIMWFRRAYYNLHQRASVLSFDESWAAGSWFVPFINLARPYRIMEELYTETDSILFDSKPKEPLRLSTAYLPFWWGLYIFSAFLGNISSRLTLNAKTLDEMINSTVLSIVASLVSLVLCWITIKVISDYASAEKIFYDLPEPSNQIEDPNAEQIIIG